MKVVVLGAGVVGSATAYMLQKAGLDVTLVDRRDRPGMETSYANGGLMNPSDSSPWNSPGTVRSILPMLFDKTSSLKINPSALPGMMGWGLKFLANSTPVRHKANMIANIQVARLSLDTLREIRAAENLTYDQTVRGTMRMFPKGGNMGGFVAMCREMEEWGVIFRTLTRDEIVETEPCTGDVAERYVGGVLFPDDESGDAHKFTCEIADRAVQHGAKLMMNTEIHALHRGPGGRITHTSTSAGEIEADLFVLSLGSYSPILARQVGLRLPILPVKGYSITVPIGDWNGGPSRPIMDDGYHAMIAPMGDRLRMGGRAEFAGYNLTLDVAEGRRVLEDGYRILPSLRGVVDEDAVINWTGLRPMTPGGPPIIGPTKVPNLFLNTGQGPLGWTMSCGSARILTEYVTKGYVDIPRIDPKNYLH